MKFGMSLLITGAHLSSSLNKAVLKGVVEDVGCDCCGDGDGGEDW